MPCEYRLYNVMSLDFYPVVTPFFLFKLTSGLLTNVSGRIFFRFNVSLAFYDHVFDYFWFSRNPSKSPSPKFETNVLELFFFCCDLNDING